jgi:hypothetical protein
MGTAASATQARRRRKRLNGRLRAEKQKAAGRKTGGPVRTGEEAPRG